MLVALDLNGTIDAAPREFQSLMSMLRSCGASIAVVTGNDGPPKPEDYTEKEQYLASLGCGECYDDLVLLDGTSDENLAEAKAQWCAHHGVDVLVDNKKANAKAAISCVPLVLVPWASKE